MIQRERLWTKQHARGWGSCEQGFLPVSASKYCRAMTIPSPTLQGCHGWGRGTESHQVTGFAASQTTCLAGDDLALSQGSEFAGLVNTWLRGSGDDRHAPDFGICTPAVVNMQTSPKQTPFIGDFFPRPTGVYLRMAPRCSCVDAKTITHMVDHWAEPSSAAARRRKAVTCRPLQRSIMPDALFALAQAGINLPWTQHAMLLRLCIG